MRPRARERAALPAKSRAARRPAGDSAGRAAATESARGRAAAASARRSPDRRRRIHRAPPRAIARARRSPRSAPRARPARQDEIGAAVERRLRRFVEQRPAAPAGDRGALVDDDLGFGGRREADRSAQSGNAGAHDMDGWAVHRAFPDESGGGAARAREIAAPAQARNAAGAPRLKREARSLRVRAGDRRATESGGRAERRLIDQWRYCWMRVVRRPARPCWSIETCQDRNSSTVRV